MEAGLAELMIRKWQTAKALALGSTHDVATLPEVHLLSHGSNPYVPKWPTSISTGVKINHPESF